MRRSSILKSNEIVFCRTPPRQAKSQWLKPLRTQKTSGTAEAMPYKANATPTKPTLPLQSELHPYNAIPTLQSEPYHYNANLALAQRLEKNQLLFPANWKARFNNKRMLRRTLERWQIR